ncbi:MAG: TraR/DksA C4-type zinc finger protein [Patescibacteria group bacterium]|nr:TraR/DksA C4-type zinc finger protein [Patescibacteria group bacterium]
MLSQEFIQKIKTRLEEEKKAVEEKILKLKKPEVDEDNPDLDDIGHDATEDILEGSLLSVHEEILGKIDGALERMKSGTYGICLKCGKQIEEEALEIKPWAEHCRVCGK